MSGTNHISQYEPPSLRVQTGAYEDGRPIYTFYATPGPAAAVGPVFNVSDYGATGDGVSDDTAALQAAINAAGAAGGGVVLLPPGVYVTSAALNMAFALVELHGSGWNTVIQPVAEATFDVIKTGAIPYGGANANNDLQGLVICDLTLDGSNMTATAAGQGNGIHFWGARQSFIRRVLFRAIKNYCVIFEGSANGGYNDTVEYCEMDSSCGGGVMSCNGNEANWVQFNEIIGCAQTLAAAQPAFGGQGTAGSLVNHQSAISWTFGNVFGGGASGGTMNSAVVLNNEGHRLLSNRFDGVMNIAVDIWGSGGLVGFIIEGNEFKDTNLIVSGPCIRVDAGDVTIQGNVWVSDVTAHYTYCIAEIQALSGCIYAHNQFRAAGTAGVISLNAASTSVATHNTGYNPRGHAVTQFAVPATTVAQTNTTGVDCMVYVTGGTVTAVAVAGMATGLTSGAFRVPAGTTIALTYSAAPTWQWYGD